MTAEERQNLAKTAEVLQRNSANAEKKNDPYVGKDRDGNSVYLNDN